MPRTVGYGDASGIYDHRERADRQVLIPNRVSYLSDSIIGAVSGKRHSPDRAPIRTDDQQSYILVTRRAESEYRDEEPRREDTNKQNADKQRTARNSSSRPFAYNWNEERRAK
jgi:hypothetical protein